MKIDEMVSGSVDVLALHGRLDTDTSPSVQAALQGLLDRGATKIVVDLDGVDFVSSAGLRVLLATAKRVRGGDGALRICGLNGTVAEVFAISGFDRILSIHADRAAALEGL